ncbi:Subunit of the glycosylphosphatidylinositol transamidase complex-like protein, partial [Kickxella alabastrina]
MRVTWCAAALAAASWSMLSGTALGESDDTASGSTSSRTSSSTSTSAGTTRRESFTEDLMIKPLADGKVLLHFEFVIERSLAGASNDSQLAHHYHLFPRQIGEIAQRYNVDELHLAFTQGNWREARWGYPPVNSQGVGAEVRARIRGAEEQSAAQWKGLTNALSGVFCASLNFIDETNTITPQLTFTDESASSSTKEGILRQGYLPRENVCTENLTPWIKQLPCQSKSGVGALLNPHRLYNMHFNSMGISLEPVGRTRHGGRPAALRYKQHLSVVLDPRTFGLGSKWTASELVGMQLAPACPVAERSTVRVIIAPGSGVRVTPAASALGKLAGLDMHTFDLKSQRSMGEIELEFDSMGAKESPLPVLG